MSPRSRGAEYLFWKVKLNAIAVDRLAGEDLSSEGLHEDLKSETGYGRQLATCRRDLSPDGRHEDLHASARTRCTVPGLLDVKSCM